MFSKFAKLWKKVKGLSKRQQLLLSLFATVFLIGLGIFLWAAITGKIKLRAQADIQISNTAYVTYDGQSTPIPSNTVIVTVNNPPEPPTSLVATTSSSTQINLRWTASVDNDVASYNLYRNNTKVKTGITGTTYSDTGLTASTNYSYQMTATDNGGIESTTKSNTATATTSSDNTSPNLIEAEGMTLSNYVLEPYSWASGGNVIKISNTGLTGTATKNYTGTAGTYDIKVYYHEESDGQSTYKLYIGTNVVDQWTADQNSGITDVQLANQVVRTKTGVSVANGAAIKVEAVQNSNEWGRVDKIELVASTGDTQTPSVPQGLSGSAGSETEINLSWLASTDNIGVTGYKIFRNNTQIGTSATISYKDTGLAANTAYSYQVSAYDAAGNESGKSETKSISTPAAPDTQAPSIPGSLTGRSVSCNQIDLSWNASSDNVGVTGYRIYRWDVSHWDNPRPASPTTYSDNQLTADRDYEYKVTALDATGNESAKSNSTGTLHTPPCTSQDTTINLTVTMDARSTSGNYSASGVKLEALPSGQLTPVATKTDITLDNSGHATNIALAGLNSGSYDFRLTVPGYLSKMVRAVAYSSTMNLTFADMRSGDVYLPADNTINSFDFGFMKGEWNKSVSLADLNGDGTVNSFDFGYLRNNWNQDGE